MPIGQRASSVGSVVKSSQAATATPVLLAVASPQTSAIPSFARVAVHVSIAASPRSESAVASRCAAAFRRRASRPLARRASSGSMTTSSFSPSQCSSAASQRLCLRSAFSSQYQCCRHISVASGQASRRHLEQRSHNAQQLGGGSGGRSAPRSVTVTMAQLTAASSAALTSPSSWSISSLESSCATEQAANAVSTFLMHVHTEGSFWRPCRRSRRHLLHRSHAIHASAGTTKSCSSVVSSPARAIHWSSAARVTVNRHVRPWRMLRRRSASMRRSSLARFCCSASACMRAYCTTAHRRGYASSDVSSATRCKSTRERRGGSSPLASASSHSSARVAAGSV